MISEETDGEVLNYHFDVRGSTIAITDENGSITDKFAYDAYGNVVNRAGTTDTEFLFCGQYGVQTDENGLIYMRARYYSPEIGRFLSLDPVIGSVADSQSLNRYAYCAGDPVNRIDPDGKFWHIVAGAVIGGVINGGAELLSQMMLGEEIDWGSVGISALSGAASGALAMTGVGLAASIAGNAAIGAAESVLSQAYENDWDWSNVSIGEVALDAAFVGVTEGVFAQVKLPEANLKHLNTMDNRLMKRIGNGELAKGVKYYFSQTKGEYIKFTTATVATTGIGTVLDKVFDRSIPSAEK